MMFIYDANIPYVWKATNMTTNCVNSSTFIDYVCALWAMQLLFFFYSTLFFFHC